MREPGNARP